MKKLLVILILVLGFTLTACTIAEEKPIIVPEGYVMLPDLEGMVQSQIESELKSLGLEVGFFQKQYIAKPRSKEFVEYGSFLKMGSFVEDNSFITVIISKDLAWELSYFEVEELPYDGPLLSSHFFTLDLFDYDEENDVYVGTGGAFHVTFNPSINKGRCIDGDTTVFGDYPQTIVGLIQANNKSTRYFNIDTPETYSGGEEPFGKQATLYVCGLLEVAESVVLQTDPGDNLLDRFGRFLAWIWILLPGETEYFSLNYMVVRQGLGTVEYLYGAGETPVTMYEGITYTAWMQAGEALAISEGRGLHGSDLDWYWDYQNERPYPGRW